MWGQNKLKIENRIELREKNNGHKLNIKKLAKKESYRNLRTNTLSNTKSDKKVVEDEKLTQTRHQQRHVIEIKIK